MSGDFLALQVPSACLLCSLWASSLHSMGDRLWLHVLRAPPVRTSCLFNLVVLVVIAVLPNGLHMLIPISFNVMTANVPPTDCPCMVSMFGCWKYANLVACLYPRMFVRVSVCFCCPYIVPVAHRRRNYPIQLVLHPGRLPVDHCRLRGARRSFWWRDVGTPGNAFKNCTVFARDVFGFLICFLGVSCFRPRQTVKNRKG